MKKFHVFQALLLFFCIGLISSCGTPKHKHAYMRKTFKQIKKKVKGVKITNINDSVKVLFPNNLMFSSNSSVIDTNIMPSIQRFSNILNKYNKTSVLISGYTDSVGTDEYNNELSANRADTAKASLLKNNVAPERINTWGMGKRHPITSNATEEGRALNRRVEFVILYQENSK